MSLHLYIVLLYTRLPTLKRTRRWVLPRVRSTSSDVKMLHYAWRWVKIEFANYVIAYIVHAVLLTKRAVCAKNEKPNVFLNGRNIRRVRRVYSWATCNNYTRGDTIITQDGRLDMFTHQWYGVLVHFICETSIDFDNHFRESTSKFPSSSIFTAVTVLT